MSKPLIHVYIFEFDPRKDIKTKNKRITKIGISNSPQRRFKEVSDDGQLKNGKILHNSIVQNAEAVEGQLHRKYAGQNIRFQTPFSGYSEFFDMPKSEQKSVIDYLKSLTFGSYSEDYKETNVFYLLLAFIAPIVLYFLFLHFK
jgi:hypothetical protein